MDYWLGIPVLNALATVRRNRSWPASDVERVGVMCSPALGDTLLFSAAVRDLRMHFDAAAEVSGPVELIHFCMRENLAAAELVPGIDRRVVINLKKLGETVRAMRAEQLDVLLDFSAWQRLTAFYSMMAGARFTVGFRTAGQHRGRGYDLAVEHRNDCHEVENFHALLREAGIAAGSEPRLTIPEVAADPLAGESDVVVFHPWASGAQSWIREWPKGRWVELAQRIRSAETIFAVTGGPADLPRCVALVERMVAAGLRAVPYLSPDGFASLSHLLMKSRVVVSVNTGVMHLAAILGAPTVSLNGPTANHRWGPRGKHAMGVQPADGSGGYLNLGFEFDGQPQDVMEKIEVDAVVSAIESVGLRRAAERGHEPVSRGSC
jgi:ADP-heptose:LPS heptosyltransferase